MILSCRGYQNGVFMGFWAACCKFCMGFAATASLNLPWLWRQARKSGGVASAANKATASASFSVS